MVAGTVNSWLLTFYRATQQAMTTFCFELTFTTRHMNKGKKIGYYLKKHEFKQKEKPDEDRKTRT